jgi:DNA-binding NarL/FixJ family response regulator
MLKAAIIEEDNSSRHLIVDQLLDKYKVSILFSLSSIEGFQEAVVEHIPLLPDFVLCNSFMSAAVENEIGKPIKEYCPDCIIINHNIINYSDTLILSYSKKFDSIRSCSFSFNLLELYFNLLESTDNSSSNFAPDITKSISKNINKLVTAREAEVIEGLATGFTYVQIAAKMFISINTIRRHVKNIYIKLEVKNKVQMVNKYYGGLSNRSSFLKS